MRPSTRSAWSLVELLVAIAVVAGLMALGFVIWAMVRARTLSSSTQALVDGVATQIVAYSVKQWSWTDAAGIPRSGQVFDLNRDGLIDGWPGVAAGDTVDGGFPPEVVASGYQGYVAMTGDHRGRHAMGRNQQPLDGWKRPLRIAFAAKVYGTQAFGIWSAGPDGLDGTADDLRSW